MRNLFPGFYSQSDDEKAEIWKDCIFILDTNVLLNLYRYPKRTSDELLGVLKQISSRLWIPFQVALEYQANRLEVIDEQIEIFYKVQDSLKKAKENLEQGLGQLQLKKRHSSIDPSRFLEKVDTAFDEFQQELTQLKKGQPNIFDHDRIQEEIDILFDGKIGQAPISQDSLNAIYKEGEKRYSLNYPPGYMDRDKDKDLMKKNKPTAHLYRGLSFERKYGDLILWHQILDEVKKNDRFKKIIFVCGDEKEDWWYKVERFGSREKAIIGPRPELIEEITSTSGITSFLMYQADSFVADANKYVGTQVSKETVEQIRDVNTVSRQRIPEHNPVAWFYHVLEPKIFEWLKTKYPSANIVYGNSFPDFVCKEENDFNVGYEVKFNRSGLGYPSSALRELITRGEVMITKGELNVLKVLLVTDSEDKVFQLKKSVKRVEFPPQITVEFGFITIGNDDQISFTFVQEN